MGCGASKEYPHEPVKQEATAEGRISAGSESPQAERPPPAALRTGTSSARTSHAPSLPHSVSEPSRYHSHLAHREGSIFTQHDKAFEQYQRALAAEEEGNLEEAEQFYNKCLEINVQELGEDHVNTFTCLSLVAAVLHAQDKLPEAESFCRRALEGRERVLGPEHEDTIASVSGLAALLHAQNKLKEAEPLYVRALQGREKSLGPGHPETLSSVQNLSALMYTMGRYSDMEEFARRSVRGTEDHFGALAPETLSTFSMLAASLHGQGKTDEAAEVAMTTVKRSEGLHGPDHPQTAKAKEQFVYISRSNRPSEVNGAIESRGPSPTQQLPPVTIRAC